MTIIESYSKNVWNRKILNFYWILLVIILIAQIASAFTVIDDPDGLKALFYDYILLQNSWLLLTIILAELYYRYMNKGSEYFLILASACISLIILLDAPNHGANVVLIFPIMISIMYFNYRLVLYSTVVSAILVILILNMRGWFAQDISNDMVLLMGGLIVSTAAISWGIVKQGNDLLGTLKDILKSGEQLHIQKQLMEKLVSEDALTGVFNHRTFQEDFEARVKDCENDNPSFHLALIDIDNFKLVNDTYGHATGDVVIRNVAQILKQSLPNEYIISRYGGEEFAILIQEEDTDIVFDHLERIRLKLEAIKYEELKDKSVLISAGLHKYQKGQGKENAFTLADDALYLAKKTGKNKIVKSR